MTPEIARSLAPDDGTLTRAQSFASPRKWIFVERNERALWGECSGSGSEPYRAVVDMNGPAYKCTCPVKRFPCKHTLALLLMAADGHVDTFGKNPPPQYVTDWLDNRDRRNAAKAEPRTEEQLAKSEASKDKTRTERLELMEDGIADLQRRLLDMVREGIAVLDNATPEYFQDLAARMVDAKVGGLSRRIKSWASLRSDYPDDWHERLLAELGTLYLFTKAFKNFDKINEHLQTEILIQAGMSIKKEDLLNQKGIEDDWLVMAQIETKEEDNLTSRRVWLMGKESGKTVLVLDFAFGNMGFPSAWINGYVYHAEVVFYPSAYPLRVVVKSAELGKVFSQIIGYQDFIHFFDAYSKAVAQNPWLNDFPVLLANVIPVFNKNQFFLIDVNKKYITCQFDLNAENKDLNDDIGWKIMALSGGKPIAIFGEWTGENLRPLSIFAEGRFIVLCV